MQIGTMDDLYPITVLMEELKNDETQVSRVCMRASAIWRTKMRSNSNHAYAQSRWIP